MSACDDHLCVLYIIIPDGVGYLSTTMENLVMGPGQNFLTLVRSDQFFVAQVGSGQPFMV